MGRKERKGRLARLHGVVRAHGSDPVVLRLAELEVDDKTRFAPQFRTGFDLEALGGDGKRIAVSFPVDIEAVPLVERKERWEDLEDDEGAVPFREDAPAPHVKVRLRTFLLRDGDRVDLWGRVFEAMGSASFRDRSESEVASMEVVACGTGEEGAARIAELEAKEEERRRPKETPRRALRTLSVVDWILLATTGVAAATTPFLTRAARYDMFGIALLLLGATLPSVVLGGKRLQFGRHDIADAPIEKRRIVIGALGLVFVSMLGMFPFIDMGGDEEGRFNHAPIVVGASAATLVVLAIYFYWATYREARIAQALLDAPPHALPWEHNTWGATEGTIATGTKRYEAKAAAVSLYEETFEEGSGGNAKAWTSDAGPFVLDADGKATVQVNATKADWGTTVRWRIEGHKVTSANRKAKREAALMPVGGRVLVAGRIKVRDGMAEMVSTGTESLLLFSTGPGEKPREVLRAQVAMRAVIVVLLVAIGAAEITAVATGALGPIHSGQGGD